MIAVLLGVAAWFVLACVLGPLVGKALKRGLR